MLRWLSKRTKLQAVRFLTAAYALCISAPSVALTIADESVAAHCLFKDAAVAPHAHARVIHATQDIHPASSLHTLHGRTEIAASIKTGDETQATATDCCGLFFAPAIIGDGGVLSLDRRLASAAFPTLVESLIGRGPERLNRPPIAL
ncbi:MAG: hypothetical protein IRY89_15510 [Pseudolabrys sp.]|nr:hypothetical protein [Pseudolabrys sp.]